MAVDSDAFAMPTRLGTGLSGGAIERARDWRVVFYLGSERGGIAGGRTRETVVR